MQLGLWPASVQFHRGQDIAAPRGTPTGAADSGTVIDSGPPPATDSGYASNIPTTSPRATGTTTATTATLVSSVQPREIIAEVGDRGESTGPHLHFQIEANRQAIDPVAFYRQQSAPQLCGPSQ